MNDQELAQFLARVTIADNRQIDALVMQHWKDCIGELDYDDAVLALIQFCKVSTDYLKPAHITEGVKIVGRNRWSALPLEERRRLENVTTGDRAVRAILAAGITVEQFFAYWDEDHHHSFLVDHRLNFLGISDWYRDEVLRIPRSIDDAA